MRCVFHFSEQLTFESFFAPMHRRSCIRNVRRREPKLTWYVQFYFNQTWNTLNKFHYNSKNENSFSISQTRLKTDRQTWWRIFLQLLVNTVSTRDMFRYSVFLLSTDIHIWNSLHRLFCRVSVLWCPWASQLPMNDPANRGFLCDKATSLTDKIKSTPV
jgi:hypothetical protein